MRPLFPPTPPLCLLPRADTTPRFPLLWMDGSMPHFRPLRPTLPLYPMSPAPCRHKAPPLGGQADDRAPLPNKAAALTVRLPYSTQATFGGGLFPPPLHPYTPGFGIGHRPPWPGVVCCPHPPGAALLPGRKVLGPTLQPMDKEHASPPIYLPPSPPEGFSGYTIVTDRDCGGK